MKKPAQNHATWRPFERPGESFYEKESRWAQAISELAKWIVEPLAPAINLIDALAISDVVADDYLVLFQTSRLRLSRSWQTSGARVAMMQYSLMAGRVECISECVKVQPARLTAPQLLRDPLAQALRIPTGGVKPLCSVLPNSLNSSETYPRSLLFAHPQS